MLAPPPLSSPPSTSLATFATAATANKHGGRTGGARPSLPFPPQQRRKGGGETPSRRPKEAAGGSLPSPAPRQSAGRAARLTSYLSPPSPSSITSDPAPCVQTFPATWKGRPRGRQRLGSLFSLARTRHKAEGGGGGGCSKPDRARVVSESGRARLRFNLTPFARCSFSFCCAAAAPPPSSGFLYPPSLMSITPLLY